MLKTRTATRKRNRGFEETHQSLIETAVRLLAERGVDSLSVSALAREAGLNRTTVYYHFPSREAMLRAVKDWSTQQLTRGMDINSPQVDRASGITRFVLENPTLIKLWLDDFISPGDVRERYPRWDELITGLKQTFLEKHPDDGVDAEVYAVMMLASAIIGPRIFQQSVAPKASIEEICGRFLAEHTRQLARDGLQH